MARLPLPCTLTRGALRTAFGVAPELVKPSPWTAGGVSAVLALVLGSALLAAGPARAAAPQAPAGATQASAPAASTKLVDINSASKAELKTLPGIGDAEADRIIKARPYPSKAKLAVDKVVSDEIYAGLKGRIIAVQPQPPKSSSEMKAASKS